mgnify:CR=1 FL=1|tara:strand:+ start:2120 stop:2596 length:477 start_codon:yes stop_codon:yes gene_type:complete
MTVYDRTANGGTVGHPSRMPTPYVITSPVWDTVDGGGVGGDIIELIDVPADTMIISGVLEVLEVRGNTQITMDVGFTGGDVDCFIDGSVVAAGFTPFLEAAVGVSGANARVLTSADTIDALVLDGGSTGETALRFRIHVCMVDISRNPTESATVSTGT